MLMLDSCSKSSSSSSIENRYSNIQAVSCFELGQTLARIRISRFVQKARGNALRTGGTFARGVRTGGFLGGSLLAGRGRGFPRGSFGLSFRHRRWPIAGIGYRDSYEHPSFGKL